ncbi:MAG: squalene--hopene cyclase [Pirellulales bacterium]
MDMMSFEGSLGDSPGTAASPRAGGCAPSAVRGAVERTCLWLLERQSVDGYWCGELEGDSILESEYLLLLAWLDRLHDPLVQPCARQLLQLQLPTGGWAMYPGGELEISGSVKAYFALKLAGCDPESEPLRRARQAIRAHGGADAVNSFTRFYLALLGQLDYEHCPAVPPEFVLLPDWAPLNKYRMSAWSRTMFVPLSIVWALRPTRKLAAEQGIAELFLQPPEAWPELRCPGAAADRSGKFWERCFRLIDRGLKKCEAWEFHPWRNRALRAAEQWMLDRFRDSDGLGAIFPPLVWSCIALRCRGYSDDSPEVVECREQLAALVLTGTDGTARLQPCQSPVWDTALTLRGLTAAGVEASAHAVVRAVDWLLDKEVRERGDWSVRVAAEPSGWFFEHRNVFYPDVDDTIMVLMALRSQFAATDRQRTLLAQRTTAASVHESVRRFDRVQAACRRGVAWTLAMQNRDGGWGAFDKDNDLELLCHVPFADHNAMIDPSTPDITARVLEMLGQFGYRSDHPAVRHAVDYLRRTQEADGAWYGRWGVNYLYGTWQVLAGLAAIGIPPDDPAIVRGAGWLCATQQASGGWGESPATYDHPELRGQGPATASQTAWALLGLMAAGRHGDDAVTRGIAHLVRTQQADGSWRETEFTGTGFPRVFYLRYHYYPLYFPLLALATWQEVAAS